eukprot:m.865543 g.865543  ORF g.865543 m.865543 type:complete len:207 (+) comp59718_c0_seq4:241-861(+)
MWSLEGEMSSARTWWHGSNPRTFRRLFWLGAPTARSELTHSLAGMGFVFVSKASSSPSKRLLFSFLAKSHLHDSSWLFFMGLFLCSPQTRFIASPKTFETFPDARLYACPSLELREPTPALPLGLFIPGGGLVRTLYLELAEKNVPVMALITFASPGDAAQRSLFTTAAVFEYLGLCYPHTPRVTRFVVPEAWQFAFDSSQDPLVA